MRFLSRALIFDLVLGVLAAVVVAGSSGTSRTIAAFVLLLCLLWVPYDLIMERRGSQ